MRLPFVTLAFALLAGGCAHYEYNITAPPELSRHIGTGTDTILQVDPLEYRFRTVDNTLVVRIFNPTDDAFQILGERSSIVDPGSQSHPLRSGPIAPHSFAKFIFPPPRPQYYDSGPTIGFGIGVSRGYGPRGDRPPRDPFTGAYYDEPRYFSVVDENDPHYWSWDGEGEARLTLVMQRGESDKTITQQFTFQRKKM